MRASFYRHLPQNAAITKSLGGSTIASDAYSRKVSVNNKNSYEHDQLRLSLKADWNYSKVIITSISAYQDYDMTAGMDGDFSDLDIASDQSIRTDNIKVFSQELRFASTSDQPLQWLGGAYYYNQQFDHQQSSLYGEDMRAYMDVFTTVLAEGTPFIDPSPIALLEQDLLGLPANSFLAGGDGVKRAQYDLNTESVALFANLDWLFTDQLTVSAGLRWTYEEKKVDANYRINDDFSALDLSPTGSIASINPGFVVLSGLQFSPPVSDDKQSRSDDNVSGNVSVAYQFNDTYNIYSSYRRGFKAGGFQITSFIPDSGIEFDEEIVDAIELGLKAQSSDGSWRANVASFYQKVSGYQVFIREANTSVVTNASDVDIKGVELESSVQLNDLFSVDVNATYLDAEFADFSQAPCQIFSTNSYCDASGRPLPGVSDLTVSATINYLYKIDQYSVGFQLQSYYKSDYYSDPDYNLTAKQGSVSLMNANITIKDNTSNWSLSFWGKNITDEEYTNYTFDSVVFFGDHNGYPSDPRTYGASLTLAY